MKRDDRSVGLVAPQYMNVDEPFLLTCGEQLPEYTLCYETYGTLNAHKDNAMLICHALSGHAHAAGIHHTEDKKPGWWDHYIGPGKPIDTNRFFVVCCNNLGGCHGSTGPNSIKPGTTKPYGADFPSVRVRDWVNTQHQLMVHLHIPQWAAVIGGSLGGMQVMRWALEYPDCIRYAVVIASSMKLTAQNIAFNEIARQAIKRDQAFHNGHYLHHQTQPNDGLSLARMIGHLTYLADDTMDHKFGRALRSGSFNLGEHEPLEFQVASYLSYQGKRFTEQFDANTYLLMTQALDYFDLAREYQHDPVQAFSHARCPFLVVSFSSDWRFSPKRSQAIVDALISAKKRVAYTNIESAHGHDAFLLPNARYEQVLRTYLNHIPIR